MSDAPRHLTYVHAGRLMTPREEINDGAVLIGDGTIIAVDRAAALPRPAEAHAIDARRWTVCPGFVDVHIHGGGGYSLMDGDAAIDAVRQRLPASGTTAFLATLVSAPSLEALEERLRCAAKAGTRPLASAHVAGINLEGPFLSPRKAGAHPLANLRLPSLDEFERLLSAAGGSLRVMTIAPELPEALPVIRHARRLGVVASVGHTDAGFDEVIAAIDAGATLATHTYNAMRGLAHREPGAVGAILTDNRIDAELIADGAHVSPAAMQVLLRCKGPSHVLLVTDNIRWAGLPPGHYHDGTRSVRVDDDACRLAGGTLAGSVAPLNVQVRNTVHLAGASQREAIEMATLTPSRAIGIDARKGSLAPGKDADLVALDGEFGVHLTIVQGQVVYRAADAAEARR